MSSSDWSIRVGNGLSANFLEGDGSSRPGIDWAVAITRGETVYRVLVRAFLANDATKSTRKDQAYQTGTVMQYLSAQLSNGWDPSEPRRHVITIGNPPASSAHPATLSKKAPWWKFW